MNRPRVTLLLSSAFEILSYNIAAEYKKQTLKRKEEDSSKLVFHNFEAIQ